MKQANIQAGIVNYTALKKMAYDPQKSESVNQSEYWNEEKEIRKEYDKQFKGESLELIGL